MHEATDNSGDVTEFCSKRKSEETERESPKKTAKNKKDYLQQRKGTDKIWNGRTNF